MDVFQREDNQYDLVLHFQNINTADLEILDNLYQSGRNIRITSPFFDVENLQIDFITIERVAVDNSIDMKMNCKTINNI